MPEFKIGNKTVGDGHPAYFIADISANHDGQLERAKQLIRLAKEAGADAAKFQNFRAEQIVSKVGFELMKGQLSHQAKWRKSVTEVYQAASLPWEWTPELKKTCDEAGIEFFSAPYDLEAVEMLSRYVRAWKIGSGDITWPEMLEKVARFGQPVFLATGASSQQDVERAVGVLRRGTPHLCVMQCNTNYTGSLENFSHLNLNVFRSYREAFPDAVLGLSDHTPGHAAVLGAVALGARAVEKHFTDDTRREGPDHPFSMDPKSWREMVDRTRELERALGGSEKEVAQNERETVVIQRRCLRAARDLPAGTRLAREDLQALRPAPAEALFPYEIDRLIGAVLPSAMKAGEHFLRSRFEQPQRQAAGLAARR